MNEIPHGKGKGHWQRVLVDEFGDHPHWGAMVWCPECGRPLFARDHSISDDGQVSPSLGHPAEYKACGWHVNPKLLDWSPIPPVPEVKPIIATCERCGVQTKALSGWGTWSGGGGLICPDCINNSHYATQEKP